MNLSKVGEVGSYKIVNDWISFSKKKKKEILDIVNGY